MLIIIAQNISRCPSINPPELQHRRWKSVELNDNEMIS